MLEARRCYRCGCEYEGGTYHEAFEFAPAKLLFEELNRLNLKRSLFVSLFGVVRPCVSVSLNCCIVWVAFYFIDIALY